MIQHQQQQYHSTKSRVSSTSALGWKSSARRWHLNNIRTKLASQQHQHEAGITTTSTRSWKYSAQGWHHNNISTKLEIFSTIWHHNNINTKLEIFSTRLASTLISLSREVLSDYTKLISKVLKLYTRQRLGEHTCNLFIRANILELYGSSLHHITDVMILDFYVF
jgi:hypothetical protein